MSLSLFLTGPHLKVSGQALYLTKAVQAPDMGQESPHSVSILGRAAIQDLRLKFLIPVFGIRCAFPK